MVDRGLQHLDVETVFMDSSCRDSMPKNIYTSKTLIFLKLTSVGLMDLDPDKLGVLLPCLKILYLEDILYNESDDDDDASVLEKLISGCPVLEELKLSFPHYHAEIQNLTFVRVRSKTLKSFDNWFEFNDDSKKISVEIDAPELTCMNFENFQSERIVVKNLTSLSMIDIDTDFNVEHGRPLRRSKKRDMIRDFLIGISTVRHMIISESTLEVLFDYSRLGPIPKFNNLHRLEAELYSFNLVLLPFPNLNNLILDLSVCETENFKLRNVPQCLLTSLECVEIKKVSKVDESVKKLVRYFLGNSALLKKLILRFKSRLQNASSKEKRTKDAFKEFRKLTKLSPNCQIIIHGRSV